MSGYVGDLSSQQQGALRKLKALFVGVPKPDESDHYYLRWLRARKFNVKKAEEMLRKHLESREENGADTILQDWTPPEVFKFFPGGFFGEDRDGYPVWYDSINLDFRGMVRSVKREDVLKYKWLVGETVDKFLAEWSEKKGKHFESFTLIIDLENMNLRRHYYWPAIKIIQEVFAMSEANFPERMKQAIIVKAPSAFPIAYNLVKHFIDHRTKQKIVMLKGDNWQEELQKYIAPDQLPQAYGGTRCEPDPWCTDHINPGCLDIPPEYYLTNLTETSRDEMERLVVNRRSDHKITCEVEEPKSLLRWEFVTIDRDISFGVYFQKGKNKEPVVPMKRRNSHVVPESGLHTCENTGTYVFKFDNSYSWTRSKEVFYSVKVYPPGTEIEEPPILSETNSSSTGSDEYYDCADDFNGLTTGQLDFNGLSAGHPQRADFNGLSTAQSSFTAESEVMEVCSGGGDLTSEATVATMKESIQTTI